MPAMKDISLDIEAVIVKLKRRPCGFTVQNAEFDDFPTREVSRVMSYACKRGLVFQAKLTNTKSRYYGRKEWADAMVAKASSPRYAALEKDIIPRRKRPAYFKDMWVQQKQAAAAVNSQP